MDEQAFKNYMKRAEHLRKMSGDADEDTEFWRGYITGLRRHYHGETFGTHEEHAKKLSISLDAIGYRREYGNGYRAGFLGINPLSLSGNSGLVITDGLQFTDADGQPMDTGEALQILRRECGAEWIAAATCKSIQTVRGWFTGRAPGPDSLRLLRIALENQNRVDAIE